MSSKFHFSSRRLVNPTHRNGFRGTGFLDKELSSCSAPHVLLTDQLSSPLSPDPAKKAQLAEVRRFTSDAFGPNRRELTLSVSEQMPSPLGAGPAHEKKIGHRRVDASGETTYKKARARFRLFLSDCVRGRGL